MDPRITTPAALALSAWRPALPPASISTNSKNPANNPLADVYREIIRNAVGGTDKFLFAISNGVRLKMETLLQIAIRAGAAGASEAQQAVEAQVLNSMMIAGVRFARYEHAAKLARDVINELAEAIDPASAKVIDEALAALEHALNPGPITEAEIAALTGEPAVKTEDDSTLKTVVASALGVVLS